MKKLYTLGLYEKALPVDLSWEEKLKVAKESGYDFLEMSIDETEEKMARLDMSEIERLQLFCTAKKVRQYLIFALFHVPEKKFKHISA